MPDPKSSNGIEKRPRYFDGQFLKVEDFTDEQHYHIDRQRRPLQFLHISGILDGLQVAQGSSDFSITIAPGSAIDSQGRQILLQTTAEIKISPNASGQLKNTSPFVVDLEVLKPDRGSTDYYLMLAYAEAKTEEQADAGSREFRRWHEYPIIQVSSTLTDQVPLAKLMLASSGIKIDSSIRRYSGVRFPSSEGQELSLRSEGGDRVILQGDLGITGNTDISGTLTVAMLNQVCFTSDGKVGIDTNNPQSQLSITDGMAIGKTYASTDQAPESGLIVEGNLGIGTPTPQDKLSIQGGRLSINQGSTNNSAVLLSSSGAGWGSGIQFKNTATNAKTYGIYSGSDGKFHFADLGIDDNRLVIDSNGKVGVGTSNPGAKLSVAATTNNANANNTAVFSATNIGPNDSHIHWGNTGDWYIRSAASSGNVILQDTGGGVCIGTVSPSADAKLTVQGTIASSMWRVTQIFNNMRGAIDEEGGGTPAGVSFSSGGGTLLILASGSGFRDSIGQIGMNIYLDRTIVATAGVFTNEAGSHKAFVCNPIVVKDVAQGTHLLYLKSWPSTTTDQNDLFSLTILELPF